MPTSRALEAHGSHVIRAAQAAQARALAECLRAMRGARTALIERRTLEVFRLERRSAHTSARLSEAAKRRLGRLRPRELEVMLLLAAGLHTCEVAEALFITEETVRTHVKQALRHSGAHSREELFRVVASARASDSVRLASRRVQPSLDQWWSQDTQRGEGRILLSEALSSLE